MGIQLRYGLLSGIVCGLTFILIFHDSLGKPSNPFLSAVVFILLLLFIGLAIYSRKKSQAGNITFNEAMKTGMGTVALAGVIFSLSLYIYFRWVNPEWMHQQEPLWVAFLKKQGKNADEISKSIKQYKEQFSPGRQATSYMTFLILVGLAFTVILSLIFKSRKTA